MQIAIDILLFRYISYILYIYIRISLVNTQMFPIAKQGVAMRLQHLFKAISHRLLNSLPCVSSLQSSTDATSMGRGFISVLNQAFKQTRHYHCET